MPRPRPTASGEGARRALHARVRRLPGRALSVADVARQARRLSATRCACSARPRSIFDPPLEVVEIPFDGKKLVGYLQKPPGVTKPPVVLHWGGVDGWKEDRLKHRRRNHEAGPGLASPSTCRAAARTRCCTAIPPPSAPTSAWLDYLPTRSDVDGRKVARLGRQLRRLLGGAARLHRRRPHQGRGVPRRQRALRLPDANGWCRPSPPAARPICSARRACSTRAAGRWASRRSTNSWRQSRRCRSRPWACSTSRRRRCSASTASSTTRRRSPTSICCWSTATRNRRASIPRAITWAARRARIPTRSRPRSWTG